MITSFVQIREGDRTEVTVTSDLAGTVFFHWYVDTQYVGGGEATTRLFHTPRGTQIQIEVLDTNDPDFDPAANRPTAQCSRRTIFWYRSLDADIDSYRVEEQIFPGGSWTDIAQVPADGSWTYAVETFELQDLTLYGWRVAAVDTAGNSGPPMGFPLEQVIRRPDAPDFAATYDGGTQRVTFDHAPA